MIYNEEGCGGGGEEEEEEEEEEEQEEQEEGGERRVLVNSLVFLRFPTISSEFLMGFFNCYMNFKIPPDFVWFLKEFFYFYMNPLDSVRFRKNS